MKFFKKKNETEKRQFIKECIRAGKVKPENEEKAVAELLNLDIRVNKVLGIND